MELNSLLKASRANTLYCYSENILDNGSKEYGWTIGTSVPSDSVFVLSSPSRSKKFSQADLERSKRHGSNLTSLSDYRKFFVSFTGYDPESFLDKYSQDLNRLRNDWSTINKEAVREDESDFYLSLADLIVTKKKFSMYGRIFKIYEPKT